MNNSGKVHWEAVKWILRYLRGTTNKALCFKGGDTILTGYVDADLARNIDIKRSTTGYVYTLGGTAMSWVSQLHKIVALSTTEAEYVAVTEASKEMVWLQSFLKELGKKQKNNVLYCDSQSVIHLAKNPSFHSRTKHIQLRYHFIRSLMKDGTLKLEKISGAQNQADMLTKTVTTDKLKLCSVSVGMLVKRSAAVRRRKQNWLNSVINFRQIEDFGEVSMKRDSGNEMHSVNELHGIKNAQNVDHHESKKGNNQKSENDKRNSDERKQFVNELNDRKISDFADYQEGRIGKQSSSSSSSSGTFDDDPYGISNLNHRKSGNFSVENSFLFNDKESPQRSTIETTGFYDNASAVFDDYGSRSEDKFDLEEEHKIHEYESVSQSHILSEKRSAPIVFVSSTSSAGPSHVDDLPPTFDNYDPSSESEGELDKFEYGIRNKDCRHAPYALSSSEAENDASAGLKQSPPPLEEDSILVALDIVRPGANVMPRSQLNQVLDAELGPGWSTKLTSFDYEPLAAASLGQIPLLKGTRITRKFSTFRVGIKSNMTKTFPSDEMKMSEKEQPCTSVPEIVSSGSAKSSEVQTSIGERSTHVHPRLPDYDTLTAFLNSLKQNRQ
ncbi:hypothetical protein F3Y22_tig00000340pilonHSYRG00351 [Hibiscus syriacus]|uniref:ABC1 atypical kinase-like domain-containing protein n=1 Tax=Hibiscus syriacus TaxID=106335 RepID=A0A6A3D451_HIBSY|nr:hypothetical protein F3Y22_tig00000340pilonHSYRG00351 [Hibiscus syriacus]